MRTSYSQWHLNFSNIKYDLHAPMLSPMSGLTTSTFLGVHPTFGVSVWSDCLTFVTTTLDTVALRHKEDIILYRTCATSQRWHDFAQIYILWCVFTTHATLVIIITISIVPYFICSRKSSDECQKPSAQSKAIETFYGNNIQWYEWRVLEEHIEF